jgi:hypothetical protein
MTILHPVPLVARIIPRITIILASCILVVPWSPTLGPALPGPRLIVGLFLFHACLPLLVNHLAEAQSKIVKGLTVVEGYILVLSPDALSQAR